MSSVEVVTFGCRLNTYESEVIRRGAEAASLGQTIIFNTCTVTQEAGRQARQAIRRARREHPKARIIVTGCGAQVEPETFAAMPEVDHVLGNAEKMQASSYAQLTLAPELDMRVLVNDIMSVRETAGHFVDAIEGHVRAFVQVQNGCDHRCTFCIIPFGRGPSRSVPMGMLVDEVARLVDNGYREIVLTGVDITSYGADLPGAPKLGALVSALLRHVPGIERLRLSSLDPVEVDAALMDALVHDGRLMPHLHLSLQNGDNLILKRMKRRHSREDAIRFCDTLRRARPDMVFGADLIAGFPTEDEAMFANTLDLVEACGLTHLHVFPFSPRKGTPAARMPQVLPALVKDRARRLRVLGDAAFAKHLKTRHGTRGRALIEGTGFGRLEDFTPVKLDQGYERGSLIPVKVSGDNGKQLIAVAE